MGRRVDATLEQNLPLIFAHESQCWWLIDAAICLSGVDALQDPACAELVGEAASTLSDARAALASLCGAAAVTAS